MINFDFKKSLGQNFLHDENIIDFYYNYILNGEFFVTIRNIL